MSTSNGELLEAARRLLLNIDTTVPASDGQPYDDTPDLRHVCRHVLATVREDDGERASGTWLSAVLGPSMRGGIFGSQSWYVQFWDSQRPNITFCRDEYREKDREDSMDLPECETRGSVRRLCSALGIELKEQP